jgi:hypothetical protein
MKKLIKLLLSYLPTKLPVGLKEFYTFADDIIELSGPYADRDSMTFAIASQLIHLDHLKSAIPKQYFVRSLRKSAANQIASQVFQDIKTKQAEALAAKQQAEETAKQNAVTDEQEGQTQV